MASLMLDGIIIKSNYHQYPRDYSYETQTFSFQEFPENVFYYLLISMWQYMNYLFIIALACILISEYT